MAQNGVAAIAQKQTRRRVGEQARPNCLERPTQQESVRYPSLRQWRSRPPSEPSSRLRRCMERIDRRTLNLVPQTAAWQPGRTPIKATARAPITRPDTYQRLPTAPPHLRRAAGPYITRDAGVDLLRPPDDL